MRSTNWAVSMGIVFLFAACGSKVSTDSVGAPTSDSAPGNTPSSDAGQSSTLDAPDEGDSSATVVPPTSSLFLTIDDMEEGKVGVPEPPGSTGGFWWPLGPFGNWFRNSPGD